MWNFERKYSISSVSFVQPRAIDGTHGWLVVFGVCLVFFFNISLLPTFNLLFQPIFDLTDNVSVTFASYIFEILTNLTILTTGFLLKDLSAKHFVTIGSSFVFFGMLWTSQITNLSELIFSYSFFIGIGLGLLNPACFIAILSCFQKSRNLAIGVAFASMGLGQLIMPHIANILLEQLNYRLTIICMAALSFIGLIGSIFVAPIKWRSHCEITDVIDEEQRPLLQENNQQKKFVVIRDVIQAADLDLLSDFNYLIISVGLSLIFAISTDFTKILPSFLMANLTFNVNQSRICLHVINLSDIIARATISFGADALKFSSKTIFLIGLTGMSIFRLLIMHIYFRFETILIFCILFGIFRAMTVVNQVLIIADFCRKRCPRKLPGTLGLSFVIKSIFLTIFNFIYQDIGENYPFHIYSHVILQSVIIFVWCCCSI
ncbi:hypothetical protein PVAND_007944 [Polypedilum vanderplanki]|uniref:Monocarboxylate transporter n=1 Tax=Polypedilum vanderplanki TaxID=319348 RepID=A0A9J6C7W7_POLVA|nr:hypothetical protein PVAND_007944 [Polypedilum vanderplanki]